MMMVRSGRNQRSGALTAYAQRPTNPRMRLAVAMPLRRAACVMLLGHTHCGQKAARSLALWALWALWVSKTAPP